MSSSSKMSSLSSSSPLHDPWQPPVAAAGPQGAAAVAAARPKMDMSKALAILGFSSSRTLDVSGGHDPKVELSNALSRQMANIERRKRPGAKSQAQPGQSAEARQRDDVRMLHEAYQFLSRKYMLSSSARDGEEDNEQEGGGGISSLSLLDSEAGSM